MPTENYRNRDFAISVRGVDTARRTADFIASTDAIDSYDEIIDQTTWNLSRYRANPVVLFGHNSRDLPIGKCTRCEVVSGRLECTIQFAEASANPKAEQVFQLVKARMLNAVSVGFRPGSTRVEMRGGREVLILADSELHEISVVPVPANPEAVARAFDAPRVQHGAPADGTLGDLLMEDDGDIRDVKDLGDLLVTDHDASSDDGDLL